MAAPQVPKLREPKTVELASATVEREIGVRLVVENDGSVSEVELLDELTPDDAKRVLEAARSLSFVPARSRGEPVRARINIHMAVRGPKTSVRSEAVAITNKPISTPQLSSPDAARAQHNEITDPEEVVVTGSRIPEARTNGVVATQVISREDLHRSGATNLGEALEAELGIQVERTFRGTEVWIRGLDPEYTLLLIDGQRVSGRVGGAIDLARFSLENIERVEIVRGPSSALYGSDAIGGTINILTRESEVPLEASAEARLATNGGSLGQARVALRFDEHLGLSLSAGRQHTDAFRSDPNDLQTLGSARTLETAATSISYGTSARRLRLNADYSRNRLEGVDAGAGGAVFDRTQLQEQGSTTLLFQERQERLFLGASAQYSQFREQYLNDQRNAVALDSYQDNREHQGITQLTVAYSWSDVHRTTVGGELFTQIIDSERLASTGFRARYSPFAEHRWALYRDDQREVFTVTAGLRTDLDSQFGHQVSPKLALRYAPSKNWTLRAGYGRGFRAPSFQELLLRFENPAVGYAVVGNPELGAESSHSIDLSADFQPNAEWKLSLAAFRNDLTNMIATVTLPATAAGTIFTYDNIDRAWTMGTEAQVVWSPDPLLALHLGHTLLTTRDEALDRALTGRPLHRFTFRAVSEWDEFGITAMFRGSVALERSYFVDLPDGTTVESVPAPLIQVDFRVGKQFTRHFELFCGITNLFNAGDSFAALLPRQFYAGMGGAY